MNNSRTEEFPCLVNYFSYLSEDIRGCVITSISVLSGHG